MKSGAGEGAEVGKLCKPSLAPDALRAEVERRAAPLTLLMLLTFWPEKLT